MFRPAFRVLLALALASSPALARAEIYRWVDEAGVTHFATDRDAIPRSYRSDAIAIGELPTRAPAARAVAPPPIAPVPDVAPPEHAAPALIEPEKAPEPSASRAPMAIPVPPPAVRPAPIASPTSIESSTPLASPTPEPDTAPTARAAPATSEPATSAPAPGTTEEPAMNAPPVYPGPATAPVISPDDPRAGEVAQLEAQIASDREKLRQMISTKRWDSAELASDPEIREIAERLPRLQAQLAALQAEPAP